MRKDSPVSFELPGMESAEDASKAASAVLAAVSSGDLTPTESAQIMSLIETYRRALETTDLERRVSELEGKKQ